MSVQSVAPQASATRTQQPQEAMDQTPDWNSRLAVNAGPRFDPVKFTRLFSRIMGAGLVCTGVGAVALAALGFVAAPVGLIAIPACLIASALFWSSADGKNEYENPDALHRYRREAVGLNLESVVQAYGWNDILRFGILTPEAFEEKYRLQIQGKNLLGIIDYYENTLRRIGQSASRKYDYRVPSPRESSKLWRQETENMPFEQILQTYPLDKLQKYAILEAGELHCLKGLKRDYDAIKANFDGKVAQEELRFQYNTQVQKRAYDQQCAGADQMYNSNDAVRELQGFELAYTRARQVAQDQKIRSKTEARARFDRATGLLTQEGQISPERLQPQVKVQYDALLRDFQSAEAQADLIERQEFERIDARRNQRLSQLTTEEARVKTERQRLIDAAKQQYDTDVAAQLQQKTQSLAPAVNSFRSSLSDLQGLYRAYLRTVRAFS